MIQSAPEAVYVTGIVLLVSSSLLLLRVSMPAVAERVGPEPPRLESLLGGIRLIRATPVLLGVSIGAGQDKMTFLAHRYYYYVLVIFLVAVALMWMIVHSPFGKALQAIRDNEVRAEFVGVQVWHYRWVAFLISGVFTGLAGALWVPLNGLTTPDILHWSFSGEIVFFTVLGGFSTFAGPIVGAVVFNYLKTFAVGYTVYWQMFLGVVLVTLVLELAPDDPADQGLRRYARRGPRGLRRDGG